MLNQTQSNHTDRPSVCLRLSDRPSRASDFLEIGQENPRNFQFRGNIALDNSNYGEQM